MSDKEISWKRRLRNAVRDRLFKRAFRMKLRTIITWKLWQRINGQNRGVWWPVHPSTVIVHPERIKLGEYTRPGFSNGCYIQAVNGIEFGDKVGVASGVAIISANHDPVDRTIHIEAPPIKIGTYAWLGAHAVILPGVEIGDHAVVGAGAVVTKSVPPRAVVVGVPARIIKYVGEADQRDSDQPLPSSAKEDDIPE